MAHCAALGRGPARATAPRGGAARHLPGGRGVTASRCDHGDTGGSGGRPGGPPALAPPVCRSIRRRPSYALPADRPPSTAKPIPITKEDSSDAR